jgi:hypothetical protein
MPNVTAPPLPGVAVVIENGTCAAKKAPLLTVSFASMPTSFSLLLDRKVGVRVRPPAPVLNVVPELYQSAVLRLDPEKLS